jgi:ubiquinone/menaquinone biosynthesis C-methylase UbiE
MIPQEQPPTNLYHMDPGIYDTYISTGLEARNFDAVLAQITKISQHHEPIRVLDLCCGTGIFPRKWLSRVPELSYTGVDINAAFLDYARAHDPLTFHQYIHDDAAQIHLDQKFDIVLATSAYHHIEDDKKTEFLLNASYHLNKDGRIIIYEKFVAPWIDRASCARSATTFYLERITEMLAHENLSNEQLFGLYNEMYLTAVREDEYKVPLTRFRIDAQKAGLSLEAEKKLWPPDGRFGNPEVGDFVVTLRKNAALQS